MYLIDSIGFFLSQSVVALYIYRVEWTCPARNPITRSKSMKISSCTRTLLGPVRPVGSCRIGYIVKDRSDRLEQPVRPVGLDCCQFWSSTYAPLFFGKACVPKNTLLDQICLRAMSKIIGHNLLFFKLMMEQLASVSKLSSWLLIL